MEEVSGSIPLKSTKDGRPERAVVFVCYNADVKRVYDLENFTRYRNYHRRLLNGC